MIFVLELLKMFAFAEKLLGTMPGPDSDITIVGVLAAVSIYNSVINFN